MLCGDLNGKEIPEGGDMCIHMASQVVLVVKNPPANVGDIKDMGLIPGLQPRKIIWRRTWQPTPVFLLENSMYRGAWRAMVHRVAKSQTQLK